MYTPKTIGQILECEPSGHEKELVDQYLEIIFNEGESDKVLAEEMFQTFESLLIIRLGDIVFQRGDV
jgi:hypothetical protein